MGQGRKKKHKKPAEPKWLITTDEYLDAPIGTIVAGEGGKPFYKACLAESCPDEWEVASSESYFPSRRLSGVDRQVLRWGRG